MKLHNDLPEAGDPVGSWHGNNKCEEVINKRVERLVHKCSPANREVKKYKKSSVATCKARDILDPDPITGTGTYYIPYCNPTLEMLCKKERRNLM